MSAPNPIIDLIDACLKTHNQLVAAGLDDDTAFTAIETAVRAGADPNKLAALSRAAVEEQ